MGAEATLGSSTGGVAVASDIVYRWIIDETLADAVGYLYCSRPRTVSAVGASIIEHLSLFIIVLF
jgi:hypothetical protein